MVNTESIKDMISLIEKNNERYHDALINLADTFDKSISNNLRHAIALELAGNYPAAGGNQGISLKNPVAKLGRLFSRKS